MSVRYTLETRGDASWLVCAHMRRFRVAHRFLREVSENEEVRTEIEKS